MLDRSNVSSIFALGGGLPIMYAKTLSRPSSKKTDFGPGIFKK